MSEKKAKVVKPEVQAKFGPSLLVFLLVTAVILVGILVLGLDAHIPIVIAAMIVAVYGIILHVPFKDLEHAMIKTISESVPVLLLICIVGMLIGSWMSAGTVPVIIYVGLELLRPSIFLPFVAIMCAILSTMTGSSWTTCSTIGVAFMGISVGLGIPLPITAGAVACGAYFGDKQSPISDFCIYAAGVTKVDIYKHAKRMIWTTGPAFLISLVIFTIIGLKYSGGTLDASAIETIRGGLAGSTVMDAKVPMMMDGNFKPGFKIDLHIKDLNNALDTGHGLGTPMLLTAQVQEMLQWLHNNGDGQSDHSAILKYYERITGVEVRK